MNKMRNNTPKGNSKSDNKTAKATIEVLVAKLKSDDGIVRVMARQQLVAYKKQSVAPFSVERA